jgi:hypothetical protein
MNGAAAYGGLRRRALLRLAQAILWFTARLNDLAQRLVERATGRR